MSAPSPPLVPPAEASESLRLEIDAFGRLVLFLDSGDVVTGVIPVRCFPLSASGEYVSLCDERGREWYSIASMDRLTSDIRVLIERELARRELFPLILKIRGVSAGAEPTTWDVDTDRGPVSFVLGSEDHIRRLGDWGALLNDTDGVSYRILDERTLDRASRKLLRRYL